MSGTDVIELESLSPLEAAARWKMRLIEEDLESSYEFELWLAADPSHLEAWDRVEAAWGGFDAVSDNVSSFELEKIRRKARRGPLFAGLRAPGVSGAAAAAMLAVTLCLAGVLSAGPIWRAQTSDVYETAPGERRVLALSDGSQLTLDTQTKVVVRYTDGGRAIRLASGQARFDVAADPSRPFVVDAGSIQVTATGTDFNIDRTASSVEVALVEGGVAVEERPGWFGKKNWGRVDLTPGQTLSAVSGTGVYHVRHTENLHEVLTWPEGMLTFDNERLSQAAERMNRYGPVRIRVEESAASLRVSGVFKTGDANTFVDAVTTYLPARSRLEDGEIVISARAGG